MHGGELANFIVWGGNAIWSEGGGATRKPRLASPPLLTFFPALLATLRVSLRSEGQHFCHRTPSAPGLLGQSASWNPPEAHLPGVPRQGVRGSPETGPFPSARAGLSPPRALQGFMNQWKSVPRCASGGLFYFSLRSSWPSQDLLRVRRRTPVAACRPGDKHQRSSV